MVEKEVLEDASAYVDELEENSEYKVTSTRKELVERHHSWKKEEYKKMPGSTNSKRLDEDDEEIRPKFLSNHTHYSPTDPDAKISTKPGKPRQLNYAGQLAVDDVHPVGLLKYDFHLFRKYIFPLPDFKYFSLFVASC